MTDSFSKKRITVTFTPAIGELGEELGEPIVMENLKVRATIHCYNGAAQGEASVSIWGLGINLMNQLTTIGPIATEKRNNRIEISAGDESGMSVIYEGTTYSAYGDFRGAPDVSFNIFSLSAFFESMKPIDPSSYPDEIDVADIMSDIALQMGKTFQNNNVSVMLKDRYYSGTGFSQASQAAEDANINFKIDRGTLSIWPKDQGFVEGTIVDISPELGMRGYPAFCSNGIIVESLFNPALAQGGRFNVTSSLKVACGLWTIADVVHDISSEMVNGPWFSTVQGYPTK